MSSICGPGGQEDPEGFAEWAKSEDTRIRGERKIRREKAEKQLSAVGLGDCVKSIKEKMERRER